jgi:hypothetical protein
MSRQANYMVRSHIRSIDANASRLKDMVGPSTQVDEWARSYVATADDRLNAVHDYLSYRDMNGIGALTKKQVVLGSGLGGLAALGLFLALPSIGYRMNSATMKKAILFGGIGALLVGGTTAGVYAWQQEASPFAWRDE